VAFYTIDKVPLNMLYLYHQFTYNQFNSAFRGQGEKKCPTES